MSYKFNCFFTNHKIAGAMRFQSTVVQGDFWHPNRVTMHFKPFALPDTCRHEAVGFEQYSILSSCKEYIRYENGFTKVPKTFNNSGKDSFRMCFVVSNVSKGISKVVDKQTVFQPFFSRGCHISILKALISDDRQPCYSYRFNELVTERIICFGGVCVYRDYLWNVRNRYSFMSADLYHLVNHSTESYKKRDCVFSLCNDIMAIQNGFSLSGRAFPLAEEMAGVEYIIISASKWRELDSGRVPSPFWPDIRSELVSEIRSVHWIDFFPTTENKAEALMETPNVPSKKKKKLQDVFRAAKSQCNYCYQDKCIWCVNGGKIISTVEILTGGVWRTFHTNEKRRAVGMQLARFAMINDGRSYFSLRAPSCVESALMNVWPDN